MATTRGSFGIIGPRFEINDTSILVARRWVPLLLALGLPVGAWLAVHGFYSHEHGAGGGGILLILVGAMGIFASPLHPPARIVVTPGLLCVGRHRYSREDIGTVDAVVRAQGGRYGSGVVYREWSIAITMLSMHTVQMKLQRGGSEVPPKVSRLVSAVTAMLAAQSQSSPIDQHSSGS